MAGDSCVYALSLYVGLFEAMLQTLNLSMHINQCMSIVLHALLLYEISKLFAAERIESLCVYFCMFVYVLLSVFSMSVSVLGFSPAAGLLQCWTVCYLKVLDHIAHENRTVRAHTDLWTDTVDLN